MSTAQGRGRDEVVRKCNAAIQSRQYREYDLYFSGLVVYLTKQWVFFVQQLFGNDPIHPRIGRGFVACAGTLSNSAYATEGGIPRSSRLEVSLKSLAFVRECPKARGDQAVTGIKGTKPQVW